MSRVAGETGRLMRRARSVYRDGGLRLSLRHGVSKIEAFVMFPVARATTGRRTFQFQGTTLRYFAHPYNATWRSERAVEIPLARHFLAQVAGGTGLEVGNVLSHYGAIDHLVVDKYEASPGVVNRDVAELDSPEPLDFVISISTLEHVGWDEEPREPEKVGRAITRLRGLLAPAGRMFVTCPLGYNPHLDALVRAGTLYPATEGFLRRASPTAGPWQEVAGATIWADPVTCTAERAQSLWVAEFAALVVG